MADESAAALAAGEVPPSFAVAAAAAVASAAAVLSADRVLAALPLAIVSLPWLRVTVGAIRSVTMWN